MAEYINMMTSSALGITLFLGGWQLGLPVRWLPEPGWLLWGLQILAFVAKMAFFQFLFVWVRWTLLVPLRSADEPGLEGIAPAVARQPRLHRDPRRVRRAWAPEAPMSLIAFFVLALLLIAGARAVITHRNPVTAAVALAFNLVAISGLYMVLDAQFIGLLQVIIYAGAIMVLILFVIMLLNLRGGEGPPGGHDSARPRAARVAPVRHRHRPSFLALGAFVVPAKAPRASARPRRWERSSSCASTTRSRHLLLLVVAMIGAVLLAKRSS
jgi:NADH-quinone oxidoreductase subunit J